MPSAVYFQQHLGAAPLNAGQNQSKTQENTGISMKLNDIYWKKEKKTYFLVFMSKLPNTGW